MKLINVHNVGRTIYKFLREDDGNRIIEVDQNCYPYYYEKAEDGNFLSYDGHKLKKIYTLDPQSIRRQASPEAYGTDIRYTTQYLIDHVEKLDNATARAVFVDIEILCDEMPEEGKYNRPISCISLFDTFENKAYTFYAGDYEGSMALREKQLCDAFVAKMTELAPDLLLCWNLSFDLPFLHHRIKNFAERISPVGLKRYGGKDKVGNYIDKPVGIACLDFMEMFKKMTLNKLSSYSLDAVLELEFGEGKRFHDVDFSELSEELKLRNQDDVVDMARLEERRNILSYFNNIRLIAKCDWEDLPSETRWKGHQRIWYSNNSRVIKSLLLQVARERKIVLPNPPDAEDVEYDGAFRECYQTGRFENLYKDDLSGCYPSIMRDFCLDPMNFKETPGENTITVNVLDRETNAPKHTYHIEQNKEALLPTIINYLLGLKNTIGARLKATPQEDPEYRLREIEYAAIKSIVNSAYGVSALKHFNLFHIGVAETTTFLVRDLLHHCFTRLREGGDNIIYADTDSCFIQAKEPRTKELNEWIQEWGKTKYNNDVSVRFDHEGYFSSICIIAKCRYVGRLVKKGKTKLEVKGLEIVRKDNSQWTKTFQTKLIEKILDQDDKQSIEQWIAQCRKDIKNAELEDIATPCKVANKTYKTEKTQNGKIVKMPPAIQYRAFLNCNKHTKGKKLRPGELFYYVNMLPFDTEETGHAAIHMGFKNDTAHIDKSKIDWDKIIERTIDNKAQIIFNAMGWGYDMSGQMSLF